MYKGITMKNFIIDKARELSDFCLKHIKEYEFDKKNRH